MPYYPLTGFRVCDSRFPFLWNTAQQPPARWHDQSHAPVQYFADSAEGAWAEVVRHEEITEAEDLTTFIRSVWYVDLPQDLSIGTPELPMDVLTGGTSSYPACRQEAARLRGLGHQGLIAPSAALLPGGRHPYFSGNTLTVRPSTRSDGQVIVLFGQLPDLPGWRCVHTGQPHPDLLPRIRPLPD